MEDNFATVKMTDKKKCLNNSVKNNKDSLQILIIQDIIFN